jgi:hypothetical protein
MRECSEDDLIALAHGDLVPEEAREVEAHVAGCAACAKELGWLKAERAAFAARSTAVPPGSLWAKIEQQIASSAEPPAIRSIDSARKVRRSSTTTWIVAAVAVAAGIAIMIGVRSRTTLGVGEIAMHTPVAGGPVGPSELAPKKQPAEAALDRAVAQYESAIGTLEKDYQARRPAFGARARRLDEKFAKMRHTVDTARQAAGDDVEGKRRVLKAYQAYLRTLSDVVLSQEGT